MACRVKLVQVACLPSSMCVTNSGIYLGTATGEIWCFDGPDLLRNHGMSDLRSAHLSSPAVPLQTFVISSTPLHCLTAPTTTACGSDESSAAAGKTQQGVDLVAAAFDGSVYGVRLPHVGATCPKHDEQSSFGLLWSQEPHRSSDSAETLSVTAALSVGRSGHMLLGSCSPSDGFLLWRPSGTVPRMREMFRQEGAGVQILLENHDAATVEFCDDRVGGGPCGRRIALGSPDPLIAVWTPVQPSLETRLQWLCLGDAEAAAKVYDAKEGLEEEMEALRAGLAVLIQENEASTPLEALDREEFCIDTETRQRIQQDARSQMEGLRTHLELQKLACRVLRDRFTEKLWKSMDRPGRALTALDDSERAMVRDFPLRQPPAAQEVLEKKVVFLRWVSRRYRPCALRAWLMRIQYHPSNPGTTSWQTLLPAPTATVPAVFGRMERMEKDWLSKVNAVDLSLMKMKVEDEVVTTPWMDSMAEEYIVHAWAGNRPATEENGAAFDEVQRLRELLYAPTEILSMSRRRIQCCLLNKLATAVSSNTPNITAVQPCNPHSFAQVIPFSEHAHLCCRTRGPTGGGISHPPASHSLSRWPKRESLWLARKNRFLCDTPHYPSWRQCQPRLLVGLWVDARITPRHTQASKTTQFAALTTIPSSRQQKKRDGFLPVLHSVSDYREASSAEMRAAARVAVDICIRRAFNHVFDGVLSEKKRTVEQINQRVKKARTIASELKRDAGVTAYSCPSCEDPESLLKVTEQDVLAEMGELPEWFIAEDKEDEEGQSHLNDLGLDEASVRALQQMMGGQLKSKKDMSALEMTVEKEPWMETVKPEEMTDLQKKKFAEYEEKARQLADLQETYRKKLEGELHRLREEIKELRQKFASRFQELQLKQRQMEGDILKQELYCVSLLEWVNSNIDKADSLDDLLRQLYMCSKKLKQEGQELSHFAEQCQALEKQHQTVQQADKEVVTSIRSFLHHAQIPGEAMAAMMTLFKQRPKRGGQSSTVDLAAASGKSSELSPETLSAADVLADLEVLRHADELRAYQGIEGVDEACVRKVLQARHDKIQTEQRLAATAAALDHSRRYMAYVQQSHKRNTAKEAKLLQKISEQRKELETLEVNVKLLIELKQGQVEVTSPTPLITYDDACLVHRDVIDDCNNAILLNGKQKINTLEMVKEFRRKIVMLDWEKRVLDLEANDIEERTKDVHMLRVTKEMQKYLAAAAHQRAKRADLQAQEKSPSTSSAVPGGIAATAIEQARPQRGTFRDSQLDLLDKKIRDLKQEIKRITLENASLEQAAEELQSGVAYRQRIRQLREKSPVAYRRDSELAPTPSSSFAKYSSFEGNRYIDRLRRAARKHTDEIDELREELNRLRIRTVPLFGMGR
ncbi:transmembrane [Cystoisospora suis]|uniref:Transmembrane n=1 Tax=Cystoisospora suis TaxID=483139 RepID=A0A2C6KKW7_9APIC|nr:transmembrane [Cystoisospora suis]